MKREQDELRLVSVLDVENPGINQKKKLYRGCIKID
jgi:hypothetical protein